MNSSNSYETSSRKIIEKYYNDKLRRKIKEKNEKLKEFKKQAEKLEIREIAERERNKKEEERNKKEEEEEKYETNKNNKVVENDKDLNNKDIGKENKNDFKDSLKVNVDGKNNTYFYKKQKAKNSKIIDAYEKNFIIENEHDRNFDQRG